MGRDLSSRLSSFRFARADFLPLGGLASDVSGALRSLHRRLSWFVRHPGVGYLGTQQGPEEAGWVSGL